MKPLPTTISTAYFLRPGQRIRAAYCPAHVVVADHVPTTGFRPPDVATAAKVRVTNIINTTNVRRIPKRVRRSLGDATGAAALLARKQTRP